MIREWTGEGGKGVKGEREGRGCGRESGSERGVRIKVEVANNRGRQMEGGKQGKEGVGKNGGVGRKEWWERREEVGEKK